jgi:hypothetical protein
LDTGADLPEPQLISGGHDCLHPLDPFFILIKARHKMADTMDPPVKKVKETRKAVVPTAPDIQPAVYEQLAANVMGAVIAIRLINALFVATFFQPDEYFQSLEPAWEIAFGSDSGAWITWVSIEASALFAGSDQHL